jgi:hypothetical protein
VVGRAIHSAVWIAAGVDGPGGSCMEPIFPYRCSTGWWWAGH